MSWGLDVPAWAASRWLSQIQQRARQLGIRLQALHVRLRVVHAGMSRQGGPSLATRMFNLSGQVAQSGQRQHLLRVSAVQAPKQPCSCLAFALAEPRPLAWFMHEIIYSH